MGFVPTNIVGTMRARMILQHEPESIQGFVPKCRAWDMNPNLLVHISRQNISAGPLSSWRCRSL